MLMLYCSIVLPFFPSGSTCKKGNDTLGYYSGDLKQLLILVQLSCRKVIATEDAFPCPMQFNSTMERMFEQQMQQLLRRKSAFITNLSQGQSRVKADAGLGLEAPVEMTNGMRCLVSVAKHDSGPRLITTIPRSWDAKYGSCDHPARKLLERSC